jgi:hypothetical protein
MKGYARKRDANERAIIFALRMAGAKVAQLDGSGTPDLIVQFRGVLTLMEVKDSKSDTVAPHRRSKGDHGELTPAQKKWWASWGEPHPTIVMTADEALDAIGATHDTGGAVSRNADTGKPVT